jgi:alanyl aminopeptidase
VRGLLLEALGEFREPALVERTLAMLLARRFDARETGQTLQALASDRLTRARTYEWVKASYDRLVEQLPQRYASYLPYVGAGFCDAERRADVAAFFGPRVGGLPGGEQLLEETLERIEVCTARRAANAAGVAEFLAAY